MYSAFISSFFPPIFSFPSHLISDVEFQISIIRVDVSVGLFSSNLILDGLIYHALLVIVASTQVWVAWYTMPMLFFVMEHKKPDFIAVECREHIGLKVHESDTATRRVLDTTETPPDTEVDLDVV